MDLKKKKELVAQFLRKCNGYADQRLAGYREQAASLAGLDALIIADKIHHWTTYKAFNEFTISELDSGELDDWFD